MRSRYRIVENQAPIFLTSTIIEWLPVFTSAAYCEILCKALGYCRENKGLKLYAYVIMDNHFHLIASAPDLSGTIRDLKSFTAKEINARLKNDGKGWLLNQFAYFRKAYKEESRLQIWQEGFHPQVILTDDMFVQKAEYIHNNPVRRGLVDMPEHWVYSSASWFAGTGGVLEMDVME